MNKESYDIELQDLFDKWQQRTDLSVENHTFSLDGIVNPDIWEAEATKTLFVLKETNRWCNLCEYVVRRKGDGKPAPKWQTWHNVVRWTYLLRHNNDQSLDEMWRRVEHINEGKRINNLRRVAIVNVKKRPGGKATNTDELIAEFERNNREFLPQEIALFGHLDYVVCCGKGISTCMSKCFGGLRWERPTGNPHRCARTTGGTLIIDFVHPQAHKGKKVLFRELYNTVFAAQR